jgi:hypothetical protein
MPSAPSSETHPRPELVFSHIGPSHRLSVTFDYFDTVFVDARQHRGRIAHVEQRQADRTVPEMPGVGGDAVNVPGQVYKSGLSSPPLTFC